MRTVVQAPRTRARVDLWTVDQDGSAATAVGNAGGAQLAEPQMATAGSRLAALEWLAESSPDDHG